MMCQFVHIIMYNYGGAPYSTEQVGKSSLLFYSLPQRSVCEISIYCI